jgi:hypothetical protein
MSKVPAAILSEQAVAAISSKVAMSKVPAAILSEQAAAISSKGAVSRVPTAVSSELVATTSSKQSGGWGDLVKVGGGDIVKTGGQGTEVGDLGKTKDKRRDRIELRE